LSRSRGLTPLQVQVLEPKQLQESPTAQQLTANCQNKDQVKNARSSVPLHVDYYLHFNMYGIVHVEDYNAVVLCHNAYAQVASAVERRTRQACSTGLIGVAVQCCHLMQYHCSTPCSYLILPIAAVTAHICAAAVYTCGYILLSYLLSTVNPCTCAMIAFLYLDVSSVATTTTTRPLLGVFLPPLCLSCHLADVHTLPAVTYHTGHQEDARM
jgi:hypothetical protein